MNSAELLVARLACGRQTTWLAEVCEVDLRSAQRWQSPKRWQPVPDIAADAVTAELDMIAEMADYACAVIADLSPALRVLTVRRNEPRTLAVAWRVLERFPDCVIEFAAE